MIYTLTLSPSLDYTMYAEQMLIGKTNRSYSEELTYGGKGINVTAALCALGKPSVALGFVGGKTGTLLSALLKEAGIPNELTPCVAPTRINLKLSLSETGTEMNAGSFLVTEEEVSHLLSRLDALQSGDTLVLSGSLPRGISADFYQALITRVRARGVRTALDASGDAFLCALSARPFLVKPNRDELEAAIGTPLEDLDALIDGMRRLQAMGAERVLLSLGAEGAMLLTEGGVLLSARAPRGRVKSAVGAGDTMLAAFLASEEEGDEKALRYAVCAGSAVAFYGRPLRREAVDALLCKQDNG